MPPVSVLFSSLSFLCVLAFLARQDRRVFARVVRLSGSVCSGGGGEEDDDRALFGFWWKSCGEGRETSKGGREAGFFLFLLSGAMPLVVGVREAEEEEEGKDELGREEWRRRSQQREGKKKSESTREEGRFGASALSTSCEGRLFCVCSFFFRFSSKGGGNREEEKEREGKKEPEPFFCPSLVLPLLRRRRRRICT